MHNEAWKALLSHIWVFIPPDLGYEVLRTYIAYGKGSDLRCPKPWASCKPLPDGVTTDHILHLFSVQRGERLLYVTCKLQSQDLLAISTAIYFFSFSIFACQQLIWSILSPCVWCMNDHVIIIIMIGSRIYFFHFTTLGCYKRGSRANADTHIHGLAYSARGEAEYKKESVP